jgi:hypothetical protein
MESYLLVSSLFSSFSLFPCGQFALYPVFPLVPTVPPRDAKASSAAVERPIRKRREAGGTAKKTPLTPESDEYVNALDAQTRAVAISPQVEASTAACYGK